MDIDPVETASSAAEAQDQRTVRAASQLTTWVAITVALLATFLGLCKVKDDNIVQAMQQAQAEKLDDWNFYQARNIREEVGRGTLAQLKVAQAVAPDAKKAEFDKPIATYQKLADDQERKKEELRVQAEAAQRTYDELNYKDDQFDLSDAMAAIAISMLAVTALTKKRWMFYLAMAPTAGGVVMGLAGLLGWKIHPDVLARLLL